MRGYDDADEPIRQGLDLGELEEDEVKSIIQRELENALGNNDGDLARQRQEALRYYDGEKFGNEVDGRSEVVMRSVLEAVEWVCDRDNGGFMGLDDWFRGVLPEKVRWVKYWWDPQEEAETKAYEALTR